MLKPTQPWRARWLSSGMPCSERLPAIQPPPWTWTIAGRGSRAGWLVGQVDVEEERPVAVARVLDPRARAARRAASSISGGNDQFADAGSANAARRLGGSSSASCSRTPGRAAEALPAPGARAPPRASTSATASANPTGPRSARTRARRRSRSGPERRAQTGTRATTEPAIQRTAAGAARGAGAARSPCGSGRARAGTC